MDIEARIKRRQRRDGEPRLIQDYDSISPVTHVDEPADRGPLFERLLDHLDPVFDGELPTNAYVYGSGGVGKSAVVTALFSHLERLPTETRAVIHTSTRAQSVTSPAFVYVDARVTTSEFAFYHAVLDALVEETVPEHGIGTETLRTRLRDELSGSKVGVVVAVDHVGEPETLDSETVFEQFAPFQSSISCLAIGRENPAETAIGDRATISRIHIEPYTQHTLIEMLTSRVADGGLRGATTAGGLTKIAQWADGDAHDALAALFGAAVTAGADGDSRIDAGALAAGMEAVPRPCVALGRVMSLPTSRKRIVRRLIGLPEAARGSVKAAAEAISSDGLELSRATIERVLYELAEAGIIRRVKAEQPSEAGRPPSRLEPRFPTLVFEQVTDSS